MNRPFLLALCLLVVAGPAAAFVYRATPNGGISKWDLSGGGPTNGVNPATRAVRYYLGAEAYSAANRAAELNAIRAAFDQWQAIPGTGLRFEEGGLAGAEVEVVKDGTNLVFWARESTVVQGGLSDISGFFAFTFNSYSASGQLIEADIVLNGVDFRWFTDFADAGNTNVFVEAVALHEIGHFIGLEHSPVGGATMFARGGRAIGTAAGLSEDEFAAARFLYPHSGPELSLGTLRGQVIREGRPVFGAVVVAQDTSGNLVSGTLTRSNGVYELPALPAASYLLRITPVDPANAPFPLLRGLDISRDFQFADFEFLPALHDEVKIENGSTNRLDVELIRGRPDFSVSLVREPGTDPSFHLGTDRPVTIRRGESNRLIGIYSAEITSAAAILAVEGDGLTVGGASFETNVFGNALHALSLSINVDSNATPGLRSLRVQQGDSVAYANGFLEIVPDSRDDNFDGLDDRFQRQFFQRFTAPEAAPLADPDQDAFVNRDEFQAGTVPTNRLSLLKIERIHWTADRPSIRWQSVPDKQYRLLRRIELSREWEPTGPLFRAASSITEYLDNTAISPMNFYQIQVAP